MPLNSNDKVRRVDDIGPFGGGLQRKDWELMFLAETRMLGESTMRGM